MGLNPVAGAIAGADWGAPTGPWGAAAGAAGGAAAALCLALPTCRDAVGNAARRIVKACSDDDNYDACTAGWMDEVANYCAKTFSGGAYRRCVSRANDRLRACKRDGGHWPPNGPGRWSRQDEHRFRP